MNIHPPSSYPFAIRIPLILALIILTDCPADNLDGLISDEWINQTNENFIDIDANPHDETIKRLRLVDTEYIRYTIIIHQAIKKRLFCDLYRFINIFMDPDDNVYIIQCEW